MSEKSNHYKDLTKKVDEVLIDQLTPALKASIDRLLARGMRPAGVVELVRANAVKAGGSKQSFVCLAVEAYLEALGH